MTLFPLQSTWIPNVYGIKTWKRILLESHLESSCDVSLVTLKNLLKQQKSIWSSNKYCWSINPHFIRTSSNITLRFMHLCLSSLPASVQPFSWHRHHRSFDLLASSLIPPRSTRLGNKTLTDEGQYKLLCMLILGKKSNVSQTLYSTEIMLEYNNLSPPK